MESFLFQATIYLGAAVIAVPLAARLGLGSVLGYLLAGIVIGPIFGLVGSESKDIQHFAEFGVVVMLFLIGLELEPRVLWRMRAKLLGLGGLQVLLTIAALGGLAYLMNETVRDSIAIGMILALSSTAIVLQTLSEKGIVQTAGGRNVFAVLLTQDIAVIPMLALMPLLAVAAPMMISPDGSIQRAASDTHHGTLSLVEGLPAWGVTLVTVGAIAVIILAGVFLTRPVFRYIHQARIREMYTALALLMVVAIAVLMQMVGLSPALGTFLAGVVLANSEFKHELETDLEPFKGLLLGLFFITVGAGFDFQAFFGDPVRIVLLTFLLIAVKGGILYGLARIWRLKPHDRWLFTLSLGQAGEFGFVLISFALGIGALSPALAQKLLLMIALSMLITPLLFILYEYRTRKMASEDEHHDADDIDETGMVIIAGIGRFGQIVNRLVRSAGFSTVVLDADLETVQTMRKFGFKGFFGDPTRPDLLKAAGIAEAKVLVVAVDGRDKATALVRYARQMRDDIHIVARARDRQHVYELYAAGANDIVREVFDSSLRAGRYALENLGLSEYEAAEAETMFYHHDRGMMKELATLWKPDVPTSKNAAYLKRAKELNSDLELSLASKEEAEAEAESKGGIGRRRSDSALLPREQGDG